MSCLAATTNKTSERKNSNNNSRINKLYYKHNDDNKCNLNWSLQIKLIWMGGIWCQRICWHLVLTNPLTHDSVSTAPFRLKDNMRPLDLCSRHHLVEKDFGCWYYFNILFLLINFYVRIYPFTFCFIWPNFVIL